MNITCISHAINMTLKSVEFRNINLQTHIMKLWQLS